jgi:poly-gamma-glutamate synthesis protein (capsule biosynthesis protein)
MDRNPIDLHQNTSVSIKDLPEDKKPPTDNPIIEPGEAEQNHLNSASGSVILSFAGDVHFSELVIQKYNASGISSMIDDEMLSHMQEADAMILNHEFVFSNRGEAMEDKEYTLRNDPKYVKILQELGTDVVTIANNHVLDFGKDAFLDTLETLENADIPYAGGGRNITEASKPVILEINGQTFAILAATRVSPSGDWYAGKNHPGILQTYDSGVLNKAIADADMQCDHVIVYVHWGVERQDIPEDYQRSLAKEYIDAGADLVIGAHPHILQGFEYYKGVPICYSLGNYLFGNRSDETILLNATFDNTGSLSIELIPCKRSDGTLKPLKDSEKLFNYLTDISFDAAVSHGGKLIQQ